MGIGSTGGGEEVLVATFIKQRAEVGWPRIIHLSLYLRVAVTVALVDPRIDFGTGS